MTDKISQDTVGAILATRWLGRDYHYADSVASTNDSLRIALRHDHSPIGHGAVLVAEYQEAGKGRMGRHWEAPWGTSLLFSVLFRPTWSAAQLPWLSLLAGLATAEAIEQAAGVRTGLKWPNDVMIEVGPQRWHKVSGLLLESEVSGDRIDYAIAGIGINVNIPADELPQAVVPATSLLAATGRHVSRPSLLADLLWRLENWYDAADSGRSPVEHYRRRLLTINQDVAVARFPQGPALFGRAEGIDELGQLIVRDEQGVVHIISAGDVTLHPAGKA
jgi:BirA family biotin operon repressor/biotin-[acetyl-CoA-carboxylase] ligase